MPWRWYPKFNKVVRADGTVVRYKSRCKKWLKSHKPYRPQKRGFEKKSIWSNRFGFLELYNRREQHELKCPSGYTIAQCFNVLSKLWHGYHRARIENEGIESMEKYAKAIQSVQKDMGIKTTSFPHLGLYGDVFILNNKKGERIVFEDHSELKKQQDKYDKWMAENSKRIQAKVLKPDKEKGEEILSFPDESINKEYEDDRAYLIPDVLIPDEEAGEEKITMTDDIPFMKKWN
jgi:hypothetical protein